MSPAGEHSRSMDLYVPLPVPGTVPGGGTDWDSSDLIIPWVQSGATYITLEV